MSLLSPYYSIAAWSTRTGVSSPPSSWRAGGWLATAQANACAPRALACLPLTSCMHSNFSHAPGCCWIPAPYALPAALTHNAESNCMLPHFQNKPHAAGCCWIPAPCTTTPMCAASTPSAGALLLGAEPCDFQRVAMYAPCTTCRLIACFCQLRLIKTAAGSCHAALPSARASTATAALATAGFLQGR